MTIERAPHRDADPHKPTVVLTEAVQLAKDFFARQCAPAPLTHWSVGGAYESLERGVHIVRCTEGCFLDPPRRHEVWVDRETGLITFVRQLSDCRRLQGEGA